MPKLRGHHLICLHFFQGEGYNAGFIRNLRRILKKAGASPVTITHGIDDVCNKCPHMKNDSCLYSAHSEDEIREMDKIALGLLSVSEDTEIDWNEIRERVAGIFQSWHTSYCITCGWKTACEKNESYEQLSTLKR